MQNDTEWTNKYYSPEAKTRIEERKKLWSPELQAKVSAQWQALFADIEAAIADAEDPSSSRAKELTRRWKALVEGFTGGDPEIQSGLNRMWADQESWAQPAQSRENQARDSGVYSKSDESLAMISGRTAMGFI